jgi:hypothetical protein
MSDILARVRVLVHRGEIRVSLHGFRELTADDILLDDVVTGIDAAIAIEEYPTFVKGHAYWSCSAIAKVGRST